MTDFEFTARIAPEPIASIVAPAQYLRIIITDPDLNRITEIPRRRGVGVDDPLNTVGTGQLTVQANDPIVQAYKNLLSQDVFEYGNIIQYWLNGVCVAGVRIKQKTLTFSGSDEALSLNIQVSGPTVHHYLDDFIVQHDGTPRPDSGTTRTYSWASRPGEWYDEDDWAETVLQWTGKNPPTARKRKMPKHWRVPSAKWIGIPGKWKYLRRTFSLPEGEANYRLFASFDEWFKLYLDGEEVLADKHKEIGYRSYVYTDITIPGGSHTIAVQLRSFKSPHGDGRDNFRFGMCKINKRGKRVLPPVLISNSKWKGHKGNPPPGWNRAQVLRDMVAEARARTVNSALALTLGFSGSVDSDGKPWTDRFNEEVDIGATVLDAQGQLSESGNFDVWVDPATLTLEAWNFRGKDKSASIALLPGINLLDYEATETDEVKNDVLIQYDGGWTSTRLASSVSKYGKRETYAEFGNVKDETTAIRKMNQVLRGIGRPNRESGTGDTKTSPESVPSGSIKPVEGMFPMIDYGTGDIISAYNASANLVPHRVMNLTLTEDSRGDLTFDGEFEEVDGSS